MLNCSTFLVNCTSSSLAVMHFVFANEGMEVRLGVKMLGVQKSERDLEELYYAK